METCGKARHYRDMYHLDHYMPLREAVWRLGKAMFPDEWTGFEIEAKPAVEPDHQIAARRDLRRQIEGWSEHLHNLNTTPTFELPSEKQADHRSAQKEAKAKLRELKERQFILDGWPESRRSHDSGADRRRAVEERLTQAFRNEELSLVVGTGRIVPWTNWTQFTDFKLSFQHSIAYTPKRDSNRERKSASVIRANFEDWVFAHYGEAGQPRPANSKIAAELWMERQLREWGQKPRPKREAFLHEMDIAVPGLSGRARLRIWDKLAPDSWKGPGPKPAHP